jgi:hypothetical protein
MYICNSRPTVGKIFVAIIDICTIYMWTHVNVNYLDINLSYRKHDEFKHKLTTSSILFRHTLLSYGVQIFMGAVMVMVMVQWPRRVVLCV